MTPFQILSDLHIETGVLYPVESIIPHSEVLVLAGDIGSFYNLAPLVDFLEKISCTSLRKPWLTLTTFT